MSRNKGKSKRRDTSSKKRIPGQNGKLKKGANKGEYKGILYDSMEEKYFLMWAFELKSQGLISSIKRADSYLLSDALLINYAEQLKTKSAPRTQILLRGHSYTPEFIIEWTEVGRKKLTWVLGSSIQNTKPFVAHRTVNFSYHSIVEIKPTFDQNNMERLFKINQKWMWQKHGIFVNLIKPQELFQKTFTPNEYLLTTTGKRRVINFKIINLFEFLNKKS